MRGYPHGAVLKIQREYTLTDIQRMLRQIKELGLNTVVIWPAIYWWEDQSSPHYPYQTGRDILAYAGELGLKVIMELAGQLTALEYAPDHLMKPEYYALRADGTRDNTRPYYDHLNYNHPEVDALISRYLRACATHYHAYPALYGYDILNETMFSSYDPYTIALFRDWLRARYGTLARLNAAWDRSYREWQQIEHSTWLWASIMPYVDWQQFRKANMGSIIAAWCATLKAVDPAHPLIADNIHAAVASDDFYDRPHDDWAVAGAVDEFGISFYPKDGLDPLPPPRRSMILTGARSAAPSGRFWISEMQTHHRTMFNPSGVVAPQQLAMWVWEAIAHGAHGLIYWKWEPFSKGWQAGGRGLVSQRGELTPRAEAVAGIAALLGANQELFADYRPETARVAILYDSLSHDFTRALTLNVPAHSSIYVRSLAGLYAGLWEQQIPAQFVTPHDLSAGRASGYRLLFLTNQVNLGQELARALRAYVEAGGIVVCDGKWGEIDDQGLLYPHNPGGPLNELLGYDLEDVDPRDLTLDCTWHDERLSLAGELERKLLHVHGMQTSVVGRFRDRRPAILHTRLGQGAIIYIATHLWYSYFSQHQGETLDFMRLLRSSYDLSPYTVSDRRLSCCSLQGPDGLLLFVFNYEQEAISATIALKTSPAYRRARNLESGQLQTCAWGEEASVLSVRVEQQSVAIYHLTCG